MIELRKAERKQAKLRIGLSGASGSGKTYSAILLAKGIASDMSKVAVIDTENGSGELYSHLGNYNVVALDAPYSPERYIEAIKACADAGMEVVIIDSVTHEWDGEGGCLQLVDVVANAKFKGNTWGAWSDITPRHQKFIYSITTAPMHIITTARSKTETVMTEQKKVKKIGMKEIQREGFEYELTLSFTIDREAHMAMASKDRTGLFIDADPFRITPEIGKTLLEWAQEGKEPETAPKKEQEVQEPDMRTKIYSAIKHLYPEIKPEEMAAKIKELTGVQMTKEDTEEDRKEVLGKLEVIISERAEAAKQ